MPSVHATTRRAVASMASWRNAKTRSPPRSGAQERMHAFVGNVSDHTASAGSRGDVASASPVRAAFPSASRNNRTTWQRVCNACMATRVCVQSGCLRKREEHSERQWQRKDSFCKACIKRPQAPAPRPRQPGRTWSVGRARCFMLASRRTLCLRQMRDGAETNAQPKTQLWHAHTCPVCGTLVCAEAKKVWANSCADKTPDGSFGAPV